ncbi:MAG: aromatic ring-hydroxylating dioxygenase subunit alpha [Novosphingobium sp.]
MTYQSQDGGQIRLKVTDPERIPTPRYYDETFYQAECDKVWPHVWQMACRLELIPNEGDWIEYSNLGKSVIVVRAKSGVKAYHNACRHRGVPLVPEGGFGNYKVQGFICPFHGWRFNTEGKCTFVYGKHMFSEHQLDQDDLNLRPCRVETWGGLAWINHDDAAPGLHETYGPVLDRLDAHGKSNLKAEWWFATKLPANWKIAMEAFMEGYHVMRTHPQLQKAAPALYNGMYGMDTGGIGAAINPNWSMKENIASQVLTLELLSEGMAGMVHAKEVAIAKAMPDLELPEDPQQALMTWYGTLQHMITTQLRAAGENVPDLNAVAVSDPVNSVEFLFPHYFMLPFFTSMSAYRIRPTGPEECIFELWSLTHVAEGVDHHVPTEPTWLPYDSDQFPPIPRQDYGNIPIQQKGVHASGFDFMRLSHEKEGMISNYNRIIDGYLEGVAPERLAAATQMLAGNFDGPILDLGF